MVHDKTKMQQNGEKKEKKKKSHLQRNLGMDSWNLKKKNV